MTEKCYTPNLIFRLKKNLYDQDYIQLGPTKTAEKPFYEANQGYFEHL